MIWLVAILVGCMPKLTERGSTVRVVDATPSGGCEYVGIYTSGVRGLETSASEDMSYSVIDIRNQAGRAGANVVVIGGTQRTSEGVNIVAAEGYRCSAVALGDNLIEPNAPSASNRPEPIWGGGRVVTENDEFDGSTLHKVEGLNITSDHGTGFTVGFLATPEDPDPWLILRTHSPNGWRFLRCHHVAMIVDDLRGGRESDHDGSVGSGRGVSESIKVHLTPALLVQMGRGTDVRVRVCDEVLVFNERARALILEFAQRVYQSDPSAPPPEESADPVEPPADVAPNPF